ncbi:hypothetical protein HID58_084425 [Brassica napus]|uniref:6-phosphogluconate dehydrogenase NADP-binding domain-containing protein n=1 Tax=Brassica napus TaxID=3708 RepID=A0ABQ7XJQ3_BRANA|nr:hypothetical protein HID58_084425 [Brassica napus]
MEPALNIAEKGFPISAYNRTTSKVDETLERAAVEGNLPVSGQYSTRDFVFSLRIVMSFYEGSWCGCFWSGQNKIPIAAASKGNCEGALPKRWQRFKNKMEMISRRVLKETDFSCSDGIAQNKARTSDNTIRLLVAETTVTKARH